MDTLNEILALGKAIRYAALYNRGKLVSRQRADLSAPSAPESDTYEELLVNPTILTLVRQRGNIDCGGALFVVVRYGNFYQLAMDLPDGHVSVCFELTANPLEYTDAIRELCW